MGTIWFCLVAIMIAMYVLLDGFDLGAGAIHLLVAKTDFERRQVLASIGPVWDGNEVWLLAAGGVLYFAFPALYASGFSGFYLPLMMVLWLLILRGSSIEFRNHIKSAVWDPLWDFLFCASSLLLAVFFGAALANVVRGVPLDASGYFFEPLWTDFRLGDETGILDWYTVLVGVLSLLVLMMHGALWVQLKTNGAVNERARKLCWRVWWGVLALTAIVTAASFQVQPQIKENFVTWPLGLILPLLAVAGLAGVAFELRKREERKALFASCLYIGDVDQRGLRRLSHGFASPQSGVFADRGKRQSRSVRVKSRTNLVDCRHDSCCRLLHLRLPFLCRQSRSRNRCKRALIFVQPNHA
jgi:cytochrome d ubiquinol oxidase subunit II